MRAAIRIVALLQIAGGLMAGVLAVSTPLGIVGSGMVEGLAFGSLLGGVLLASDRRAGVRISVCVQALQILRLQTQQLTYLVTAGPQIVLGLLDGQLALMQGVGFGAFSSLYAPQEHVFVGLNLIPLLAVIVLILSYRRVMWKQAEGGVNRPGFS